jgi:hypothetical protein
VPVTECWRVLAVFRRNHRWRSPHLLRQEQSLDDGPCPAATRAAMQARLARAGAVTLLSGRLVCTERNHGVSGAEPTIGPDLSERVEQVRAACLTPTGPGSSRTWARRWTWPGRPKTSGRSARSSRAGGGWFAQQPGGRRPRRGCARVMSPSGRGTVGRGGRDQPLSHLSLARTRTIGASSSTGLPRPQTPSSLLRNDPGYGPGPQDRSQATGARRLRPPKPAVRRQNLPSAKSEDSA